MWINNPRSPFFWDSSSGLSHVGIFKASAVGWWVGSTTQGIHVDVTQAFFSRYLVDP